MKSTKDDLLPGLPNDVALECLIRIPVDTLPGSCHVSTGWRAEIESPEFLKRRKNSELTRSLIVVSQAWNPILNPSSTSKNCFYRLVVCDPEKGKWSELPPIPYLPTGLPVLCHLAGVGSELVVIGGCDPVTWQVLDSVFIYSFVSGTWRSGAHMPGGQRLLFGSASDSDDRTVYIAGGHNEDKNSLNSALAYDVALDKWTALPDMKVARDECVAVFHRKKFHVISGYGTETQGVFGTDSEAFDVATWRWGPVEEHFLMKDATSATRCAAGGDMRMYACGNGNVMEREGATWRVVVGLPEEVRHVDFVTAWRGKLLVVGYAKFEDSRVWWCLMDLETRLWTKIEASQDYLGHVQSGCYLEI